MSALFAATHPDRVDALILFGTFAHGAALIERAEELGRTQCRTMGMLEHWGEGRTLEVFAPSIVTEERIRRSARSSGPSAARPCCGPGGRRPMAST